MSCPYKDLFGKPGEGPHSLRVFDIAIVDVVLTLLSAYALAYTFRISFLYTSAGLFLAGIVLHRLFCVRTTVDKWLF